MTCDQISRPRGSQGGTARPSSAARNACRTASMSSLECAAQAITRSREVPCRHVRRAHRLNDDAELVEPPREDPGGRVVVEEHREDRRRLGRDPQSEPAKPAWSARAFSHSRATRSGSARRMRRLSSAARDGRRRERGREEEAARRRRRASRSGRGCRR